MSNAWIVATDQKIAELLDACGGRPTSLVAVGWDGQVAGVADATAIVASGDAPLEALAPAVVAAVNAQPGDRIIVENTQAGRVFAGALAASAHAPILQSVTAVSDDTATVARYGGLVIEKRALTGTVVLVMDGATSVAGEAGSVSVSVSTREESGYPANVTAVAPAQSRAVDLTAAKSIVAVGRGFKEKDDLALAEALAASLGAELACSRPLAEGQNWLARDRYVGVSGAKVSPELYLAVGISGELQHMAGLRGARSIVAINSDPQAPIFSECDFGIVGDLYQVLPKLSAALQS